MRTGSSDPFDSPETAETDRDGHSSVRRVEELLERTGIATVRLTRGGEFARVSDAFATLTGYPRAELRNRTLADLLATESPDLDGVIESGRSPVTVTLPVRTASNGIVSCDWHLQRIQAERDGETRNQHDAELVGIVERTTDGGGTDARVRNVTYGKTFAALAEALPDGIIVLDTNSDVHYANPAVERILGYEPDDLVGDNKVKIIPDRLRDAHLTALQRYLETGEKHINWTYVELPGQHRDGFEVPLGVSLNDFFYEGERYFVGLFRDISPRKRAERQLAAKVAQQEAISYLGRHALETADVDKLLARAAELATAAMDVDYCDVLEVRDDADPDPQLLVRAGVGWDDDVVGSELVSAGATESVAGHTLSVDEPVVVEDLEADPRFEDSSFLSDHGIRSGISVRICPSNDSWGIIGIHDTERREFADHDVNFVQSIAIILATAIERSRYEDRLTDAIAELEESNDRLEQFAYVASHDLQEPLRMVTSYLQLLEGRYADDLDDDAQEFVDFAVDGAERMRTMIDDLLAYSRVDTRAEPFEPTDLEAVVERVRTTLQVQLEETDTDLAVSPLPTVVGDDGQLEQLFQNLLSNAIKYSDGRPRIEIDAERRGEEWLIRVADDGIGIDPDQVDDVFEIFHRLHSGEEYSGTGIGLALCRKIVDRHGGRIWLESEPSEGTTVFLTIPVSGPDSSPRSSSSSRSNLESDSDSVPETVDGSDT